MLVIGGNQSGMDIGLEISKHGESVTICHNDGEKRRKVLDLMSNHLGQCDPIKSIENNLVTTVSLEQFEVDAILFCTGWYSL